MSFLSDLNPVQRAAVQAVNGPVMIVAGAGSGKTRVLTYRAAYLVHLGVRADSILALTFTNKAANEMKSRIIHLVGEQSRALWMGTFHSIFARLLRVEAERIGFTRSFTIYDADDSLALIKNIMNGAGIPQQQFSPQGIRSRISHAKNGMITPKAYKEKATDIIAERTAVVFEHYTRKLKQMNAMDFDDLLLKPLELFSKDAGTLERYQHRFKYILVDEYQDTNRVQYHLINTLAAKHRNICVVGDDAQSIYAFRGADIRNILDFERDYPDAQVFRLEQNYRSTKTILAAANSVIERNEGRIKKELWTDNGQGERVVLTTCEDERDEGYRIVQYIEEESQRKKMDLKHFAVLYRTNSQSRPIEDALRRSGMPYTIVSGVEFYRRKEIKDILAYLNVIVNPKDEAGLLRIINTPARGIGDTTITRVLECARKFSLPLFDALGSQQLAPVLGDRAFSAVQRFHRFLAKYISLKGKISVSELARTLVDELGVLRILKEEGTPEALARRENVQELVSALAEFTAQKPDAGLEEFLQEVSLVSDVDTADFERNAVTLMTLHAAKGLEFPVVFVTGLEEGLFPLSADIAPEELEEERRLMYVGMTRAMQKLYLLYATRRYRYGELTFSVRSRFLEEIDTSLLSAEGAIPRRTGSSHHRQVSRVGFGQSSGSRRYTRRKETDDAPYFSDTTPDYENESQDGVNPVVGTSVMHESFGHGRVVALDGRGDKAHAIVDFDSVGRKHLLLKYAHLRKA
jgi:DNA helicase-2/ATP-dependent DNA helicase PcrA